MWKDTNFKVLVQDCSKMGKLLGFFVFVCFYLFNVQNTTDILV